MVLPVTVCKMSDLDYVAREIMLLSDDMAEETFHVIVMMTVLLSFIHIYELPSISKYCNSPFWTYLLY